MQVMMKTSAGDILIKLYADEAPETVGNFVKLVEMGHYNAVSYTHLTLPTTLTV